MPSSPQPSQQPPSRLTSVLPIFCWEAQNCRAFQMWLPCPTEESKCFPQPPSYPQASTPGAVITISTPCGLGHEVLQEPGSPLQSCSPACTAAWGYDIPDAGLDIRLCLSFNQPFPSGYQGTSEQQLCPPKHQSGVTCKSDWCTPSHHPDGEWNCWRALAPVILAPKDNHTITTHPLVFELLTATLWTR